MDPDKVTSHTSGIGRQNALKPQPSAIPDCPCENCVEFRRWNAQKAAAKLHPPVDRQYEGLSDHKADPAYRQLPQPAEPQKAADSTDIILASREQVENERALWTDMAEYPSGRPDLPAFLKPPVVKKKSRWERAIDWLFGAV